MLRLAGLSVTMPLKAEVAEAADVCDDEVEVLSAANCIVPLGDGRLRAKTTDAAGFVSGLRADAGVSPDGSRVALIGGGGAARAVAWGLAVAGAVDVAVINRTPAKAQVVADIVSTAGRAASGRVGTFDDIAAADIVVNATSVGMGAVSSMPCDPNLLHPGQIAVDLVYEPLETVWLAALRSRGVEAHNGLSMLAYQAAAAFELWTGIEPPVDAMRQAAVAGR